MAPARQDNQGKDCDMEQGTVLVKTAKGQEEIEKRTHKLAGRLRAVLFMVDGQRSVGDLLEQAGGLADQLAQQLEELLAQGFLADLSPVVEVPAVPVAAPAPRAAQPPPPQAPRAPVSWTATPVEILKPRLARMLTDTLGMRAMFLTAQINAVATHRDLERTIDEIAQSWATTAGAAAAAKWRDDARRLVGLVAAS